MAAIFGATVATVGFEKPVMLAYGRGRSGNSSGRPMIPWTRIASAKVPQDAGELRLMKRGDEFSIMLGATELMNSRRTGSERALGTIGCQRLRDTAHAAVLVGGLGMGFTLRAALAELNAGSTVTVVELIPAVVEWARGPMAELFGNCLEDPRVVVREGDVGAIIRRNRAAFDAILLDVDNGPDGLTQAANDRLYDLEGLGHAWRALRPNGVLAVWSSASDEAFSRRLRQAGFSVEILPVRAAGKRGSRDVIWIAARG
jgi:spermidine synthase